MVPIRRRCGAIRASSNEQPAVLLIGDGQVDCVVHDISAGGALIAVSRTLKVGETVILALDSIGKLPAEIRHSDGGRAGLRFIIDPKQQLFLVKHLSAVIAAASTTVATADAHAARVLIAGRARVLINRMKKIRLTICSNENFMMNAGTLRIH